MKKRYEISAIMIIMLLICLPVVAIAQTEDDFVSNGRHIKKQLLDADVRTLLENTGIPALSLAIIDNDSIVFHNQYGYRNLSGQQKVDPETVFEACSLSKVFLVYVVYKLVQQGQLDLSKPMCEYQEYPALMHDERYKRITPGMIISHTSGMENWIWDNTGDKLEIVRNPGEAYTYSGEGFQYLAKVVEGILHSPYDTYIDSMVLKPFGLKNTYLKFSSGLPEVPSNYTFGHNSLGKPLDKWKPRAALPSTSVHTTAADFARLVIAIFAEGGLNHAAKMTMLQPVMQTDKENPFVFMSYGFGLIRTANDTIVSYNGSNDGFKARLYYSVPHKRGLIYLTNSDRGGQIDAKLASLSGCGLDPAAALDDSVYCQYPGPAFDLLGIYREKGIAPMMAAVEAFAARNALQRNTLNELADIFLDEDITTARQLLTTSIRYFPTSALSHFLMGMTWFKEKKYGKAQACFVKAKALQYDQEEADTYIRLCKNEIKKEPALHH
ncbi:serine hydrolase domain-containing protein [Chitinophaga varians]|uniref:serine hydrolase domain-containing protein n=1 Tax=Chitinophaga varians TaxID=2202339 RepID=UPI00165F616C|nr:serine hydrolase domain-containing protein [Chitinophaga varians]MBC9914887.1 beta-lactamase family protein [Chitinophaga varians]